MGDILNEAQRREVSSELTFRKRHYHPLDSSVAVATSE